MNEGPKRLYRSTTSRVISGVCGGIAEYLNVDPVIVRVLWVLITVMGGMGVLLYFIGMIIIPLEPPSENAPAKKTAGSGREVWGIILIVIGVLILGSRYALSFILPWHWHFGWDIIGPGLIILFGIALMFGGYASSPEKSESKEAQPVVDSAKPQPKKLYRIREGRMLLGVAGGLGEYFNIYASLARILWAAVIVFSGGFALLLYFLLYFIVPEKS